MIGSIKNLKVFDVGNIFGTMNTSTIRFSNITEEDKKMICKMHGLDKIDESYVFTSEDKKAIFMNHRIALAREYGFDCTKMFMADQKDKIGTYRVLDMDYVDANPDGWSDIDEDILIIRDDVCGVVAGHPVADCPVIVMEDIRNGISAVCHCSAELIDKRMPMLMADALLDYAGTCDCDISAYVSSCAGDSWTYDGMPSWMRDTDMWLNSQGVFFDDKVHINLRNAIRKQLAERGIVENQILFSDVDTITNPDFYSNSASSVYGLNMPEKFGRNFTGAVYENLKVKVKTKHL